MQKSFSKRSSPKRYQEKGPRIDSGEGPPRSWKEKGKTKFFSLATFVLFVSRTPLMRVSCQNLATLAWLILETLSVNLQVVLCWETKNYYGHMQEETLCSSTSLEDLECKNCTGGFRKLHQGLQKVNLLLLSCNSLKNLSAVWQKTRSFLFW